MRIRFAEKYRPVLHTVFSLGGYFFCKTFLNLIRCELAARIDQLCYLVVAPQAESEREIIVPPAPEAQTGGDEEISIRIIHELNAVISTITLIEMTHELLLLIFLDDQIFQDRVARIADAVLNVRGAIKASVGAGDFGLAVEIELRSSLEHEEKFILGMPMWWVCGLVRFHHAHFQRPAIQEVFIDEPILVADFCRLSLRERKLVDAIFNCELPLFRVFLILLLR